IKIEFDNKIQEIDALNSEIQKKQDYTSRLVESSRITGTIAALKESIPSTINSIIDINQRYKNELIEYSKVVNSLQLPDIEILANVNENLTNFENDILTYFDNRSVHKY